MDIGTRDIVTEWLGNNKYPSPSNHGDITAIADVHDSVTTGSPPPETVNVESDNPTNCRLMIAKGVLDMLAANGVLEDPEAARRAKKIAVCSTQSCRRKA